MSDPMQEIRNSFFIECDELLEGLQDSLVAMEGGDESNETINVAFRAVHSIKGGAGAFGLDQLVGFAHTFETAMDDVRSGRLALNPSVVQLFFQCGDMLSDLVRVSREGNLLADVEMAPLVNQLKELSVAGDVADTEEEVVDFQPMGISLDLPGLDLADDGSLEDANAAPVDPEAPEQEESEAGADDATLSQRFEITFAPEPELYRTGNEPLFLLRALKALGPIETSCTLSQVPDLGDYSANSCLFTWRILLTTNVEEPAIREVFDFVEGLCRLEIRSCGEENAVQDETKPTPAEATAPAEVSTDLNAVAVSPELEQKTKGALPPPQRPAPEIRSKSEPAATPASGSGSQPTATVRVELDRVDRLVNLVGELVINQAMLSQSIAATGLSGNSKIATGLDEFSNSPATFRTAS